MNNAKARRQRDRSRATQMHINAAFKRYAKDIYDKMNAALYAPLFPVRNPDESSTLTIGKFIEMERGFREKYPTPTSYAEPIYGYKYTTIYQRIPNA